MSERSIEQLCDEIRKIDDDLARLSEQSAMPSAALIVSHYRPAAAMPRQKSSLSNTRGCAPLP